MSIRAKIISGSVVVLLLFMVVMVSNYLRSSHANDRLVLGNELFLPLSRQLVQLSGNIQVLTDNMRRFYFGTEFTSESSTLLRVARDLYPYVVLKKFHAIEEMLAKYESDKFGSLITELVVLVREAEKNFEKLRNTTSLTQFEKLHGRLNAQLRGVTDRVDEEWHKITVAAQREGRENLVLSLVSSLIVALFGLFSIFVSYKALKSLPSLIKTIDKIADGDFDQSIKLQKSGKDEISLLSRQVNRMLVALRARDKKIIDQQGELLQSERLAAVGQLSAEIVHEIRNPLNSIALNIDWIASEIEGGDPEIQRTLKSTSKEVERLNQITESYLVRARVNQEKGIGTEIHGLLDELIEFSKEEYRIKNIDVQASFASNKIYVQTDRARLKQAFLNVMKNAREAMPHGGQIEVKSEIKDNISRVWFSDTGHGMTEATRKQSFQPFFTTKRNGTGLGLVVTKSVVEEAQGTVQCHSKIGRGTTVTFQFPV